MSWGFVAVGVGTLVGGYIASEGAKSAAEEQAEAAEAATAESASQFAATQASLAPFTEAGEAALEQQSALLGLSGTEAQQAAFDAFAESPGQQYLREQQERALVRNASAVGGLGGGNVLTALQEQAAGIASTDLENQLNRLAGISGTGQTAATDIGALGAASVASTAESEADAAAARASGILGQSQAIQQTISGLTGAAAQSGLLSGTATAQSQTLEEQLRAEQGLPTGTFI